MRAATKPLQRRFSLAQLTLLVPWVALVIAAWGPITDNSFLWHVRAGSLQIDARRVLTKDPFSFTVNGEEWLTQSWLVELLYAWGEDISGLGFVPWMILIVGTLTFCAIGLIAFTRSGSVPTTAALLILSTILMISFLVPRPVIFSFLAFALVILVLEHSRLQWSLPFIFWIWASVHASFAIGLVYLALVILARRDWKGIRVAAICGGVTLLTAHGLGVVQILLNFAESREVLPFLTEWRTPALSDVLFIPFAGGMLLIVAGAFRGLIRPRDVWVIGPFLLLGVSSIRAVPAGWLGVLSFIALALSGFSIGAKRRFGATSAALFVVFVALVPFLLVERSEIAGDRFPVAASEALRDLPTFHDDRVGGYLIWAQWPERLVYLDDRAELYEMRIEEFVAIRRGEKDWRPVFERDGIKQVLLKSDEPLLDDLAVAGWRVSYDDDIYTLMHPGS